jgi:hypothetical protein
MVKKLIAGAVIAGGLAFGGATVVSAHPISAPADNPGGAVGHSGAVDGDSAGHVNGLECAARMSPVIGTLGLNCRADGSARP